MVRELTKDSKDVMEGFAWGFFVSWGLGGVFGFLGGFLVGFFVC